jgi:hypothetical protein
MVSARLSWMRSWPPTVAENLELLLLADGLGVEGDLFPTEVRSRLDDVSHQFAGVADGDVWEKRLALNDKRA